MMSVYKPHIGIRPRRYLCILYVYFMYTLCILYVYFMYTLCILSESHTVPIYLFVTTRTANINIENYIMFISV